MGNKYFEQFVLSHIYLYFISLLCFLLQSAGHKKAADFTAANLIILKI